MGVEKKVEKLVSQLESLEENKFKEVSNISLDDGYSVEVGYAFKNNRGSYQLRVRYGITTLLKIRNSTEFKQLKKLVEFLEKNKHVLYALDKLNRIEKSTSRGKDFIEI